MRSKENRGNKIWDDEVKKRITKEKKEIIDFWNSELFGILTKLDSKKLTKLMTENEDILINGIGDKINIKLSELI